MITFIYRKGSPTIFSIEKLFDALYVRFEHTGLQVTRLEVPFVSKGMVSVLRNIWFVARRRRTGLLHITGDVHYAALLCPFAKTLITIHDCVALQRGTGFKRWVMWLLWFGLPVRRAAAIAVISDQTRNELMATVSVPQDKITVLPNFVDPSFTFSERRFAAELPRILHVGTTPNKNLKRVVAALRGVNCVLVIVGQLQEEIRREMETNGIRFENYARLDHDAIRSLYRDADIISFPSTYEGFGMPILEGQATGRPVLTSDREPMRSVSGEGGAMLIDPESVEAIRSGFLQLLNDAALRARLVSAGQENSRRFSIDAVAAGYLALYRRLEAM